VRYAVSLDLNRSKTTLSNRAAAIRAARAKHAKPNPDKHFAAKIKPPIHESLAQLLRQ